METLAHGIRTVIEYGLAPFDALPAFWGLTLLSVVTGVVMLWVVKRTTPQRHVSVARDRMAAAIYEMRLYLDSPRRIVSAQGRLLFWSVVYTGSLLPAFIVLTIPLGLLYLHLDVRHGQAALPSGEPVLIIVELEKDAGDKPDYDVTLAPSPGVTLTAPPLHIERERRVYLRVTIDEPGRPVARIRAGEHLLEKQLSADPSAGEVKPERTKGMSMWWSEGDEDPLPDTAGVHAIRLRHPAKAQSWLGVDMPWWVYWLLVATVAALLLRRRAGVVF